MIFMTRLARTSRRHAPDVVREYLDKAIAKLTSAKWVSVDLDERVTLLEAQA